MDLDFKEDGNNTVVTAYVFPGSVRYFALAPHFFYGVKDIDIAVCNSAKYFKKIFRNEVVMELLWMHGVEV
jgi:hypothetical protein